MWLKLPLLLFCTALLCGCSKTGLGSKNILRGVYLEREEGLYQVRLICCHASPAADAGEAQEQSRILAGQGESIFEAVQAARQSRPEELFYGLNELLLIGPQLAAEEALDAADFFAGQQAGRPNTSVYLTDLPLAQLDSPELDPDTLVDGVELLQKRGILQTHLYQLAGCTDAVLPRLHVEADRQSVTSDGAMLYRQRQAAARLDENSTALVALLTSQSRSVPLRIPWPQSVHFRADSVRIQYEVQPAPEGMMLCITLRGAVRQLQSRQGAIPTEDEARYVQEINGWIEQQAGALLAQTLEQDADVLGLIQRFSVYDAAGARQMLSTGAFRQGRCVRLRSCLHLD